jgi:hypothetical protein
MQRRIAKVINWGDFETAFRLLGEPGNGLSSDARADLARKALDQLAGRVEKPIDAVQAEKALKEVRAARAKARPLQLKSVDRALVAVEARTEHLELVEHLKGVSALGERREWHEAALRAQSKLQHPQLTPEAKQILGQVVGVGEHTRSIAQLESAVAAARPGQPAALAGALRPVSLDPLSPPLREQVRALRSLADINAASDTPWRTPPDTALLKRNLMDVQSLAGEPALASRVQLELAVKLFLDGFPKEARELLPDEASAADVALLLNDLKALVLGQGQVRTWPARRAWAPAPAERKAPTSGLPVGVRRLLPESQWGTWQAPAPAPAPETARPLEELARKEQTLRETIRASLEMEREALGRRSDEVLRRLTELQQQFQQNDKEDAVVFAEVENRLKHSLSPAERALAWHLRREGQKVAEIAALLQVSSAAAPPPG